jgi:hypothetical protein
MPGVAIKKPDQPGRVQDLLNQQEDLSWSETMKGEFDKPT